MWTVISIILTIVLWIIESFCSKLKNALWGGIIPFLILIASIYILATGLIELDYTSFTLFFVINFFMFEGWIEGRVKYKQTQKQELNKMKAHDIEN